MSHSGIFALGLPEERLDQFRQALDAAQRADGEPLHFVLALHELARDLSLHMRPHLFIGVQVQRVRRQVEELELDQIVLNNYHTDSQYILFFNPGGGQGNPNNHFDNPNNGPVYVDAGSGGFVHRERLPSYRDGANDKYIQDALDQINAKRMYYANATFGSGGGSDISRILSAFGQNSHALADFYAHTNWVDAPTRGGCVSNRLLHGALEHGYIPIGLAQTRTWDEGFDAIAMESLYSGTVSPWVDNYNCMQPTLKPGDVGCTNDKTTHGYWNKDDDGTPGGGAAYTGPLILAWGVQVFRGEIPWREEVDAQGRPVRVDLQYGTEWHGEYGVEQSDLKAGDRIYVQAPIATMHQLAFHLAVEHTKLEIELLYQANGGHSIGGVALHDVFKMDAESLARARVAFDVRHSKQ